MIKRKDQNENGFAFITVLIIMVALSILFASIVMLTDTNTKQLDLQEDHMRAYYIAKSGIEIAYAALMTDNTYGVQNIRQLIEDKTRVLSENGIDLPNDTNPIGSVDIEVKIVDDEVRIYAQARLTGSSSTATLALYIDQADFNKTRWGRE